MNKFLHEPLLLLLVTSLLSLLLSLLTLHAFLLTVTLAVLDS